MTVRTDLSPQRGDVGPRHDVAPPQRGEVWQAYLDPTVGREQAGRRPVVVMSRDDFNAGLGELVFVVPMTSTDRQVLYHVRIAPPEGGVQQPSVIMTDQLRSISTRRLRRKIGSVNPRTLAAIDDRLRILLDL